LHGANRLARLVSIKGGSPPRLETKATTGVVAAQRRVGMPTATPCSVCGRPAAAVVPGGLRAGESMICPRCVEVADDHTDTATISAGDLAELDELGEDELTSEQEYAQALGAEGDWRTCSQSAPSPAAPTTPAAAAARRDGREREPLRGRSP